MAKRLKSIRSGIEYQDLVAAEAALEMVIENESPPIWVSLENRRGGSFDDVVVAYPSRVVWKQVKWAENPGSEPLTIDTLASRDSRKKPLIKAFAESYAAITAQGSEFALELVTNRALDKEFQTYISGSTSRIKEKLTRSQRTRLDSTWRALTILNPTQFGAFLRTLSFLVNSPDISRLETAIRRQLRMLRCEQDAYERLLGRIREWAKDDAKDRITPDDIEQLLSPALDAPPNQFQLPTDRVDRPEAKDELARRVDQLTRGYIVVLGSPGSGKSTLLNTLGESGRMAEENDLVVYNCFTGTSDAFLQTRATAGNFARYLARKLYDLYPDFGRLFNPGANAVEAIVSRVSKCNRSQKLVVVIDGVDYARRFAAANGESLFDHLPPQLPDNVVIIVSAQVAGQLPAHLRDTVSASAFTIQSLDANQVKDVLARHGIWDRASLPPYEVDDVVRDVLRITGGHALHVSYIARQLAIGLGKGANLPSIIHDMEPCGGDIELFYQRLFSRPGSALARDALSVMAESPCELTPTEIATLLGSSVDARNVEDALEQSAYLFEKTGGVYYFSHDSLRAFALSSLPKDQFPIERQIRFFSDLRDDPRTGEHLLRLLAKTNPSAASMEQIDCDWLARQVAIGANVSLLREGLERLAVAECERDNWTRMAHWWSLKSCLERAEFEGELHESTVVNAWLAMGRRNLVERYAFVTSQFFSSVFPGPDLIDLLNLHGHADLAERLSDQRLTQSIPDLRSVGPNHEFESYVRHLGRRASPGEVVDIIRRKCDQARELEEYQLFWTTEGEIERLAKLIVYDCLFDGDFDSVDAWLTFTPSPFSEQVAADVWLRLHLGRGDLAGHWDGARLALKQITDVQLLANVHAVGLFRKEVRATLRCLPLPSLTASKVDWLASGHSADVRDLYCDFQLCHDLGLDERLRQIESAIHVQPNRIAHAFNSALGALARRLLASSADWKTGVGHLTKWLAGLESGGWDFEEIHAAEYYVGGLGTFLRPACEAAKSAAEATEFGDYVEETLIPALRTARIGYDSGPLSICDLLQSQCVCGTTVLRLLTQVETSFNDDNTFKSGPLIDLSVRFARAGDLQGAERSLVSGVRATFTYGYHKDTTINEFILAFEAIAPHLGQRGDKVVQFITSVLLLLDRLTDARMISEAPAHFVAVVCKFDVKLGSQIASILQRSCRQLRSPLAPALHDHGLDVESIRGVMNIEAPALDIGEVKKGDDARAYFVADDTVLPSNPERFRSNVRELIESSSFGSGLHRLRAIIVSLVSQGQIAEAIGVFNEFEHAIWQLVAVYPPFATTQPAFAETAPGIKAGHPQTHLHTLPNVEPPLVS